MASPSIRIFALLFLSVAVVGASGCDDPVEKPPADTIAVWRTTEKPYRQGLTKQIVSDGSLVGKTRAQVEQLLGPPDAANQYGQGEWCFEIGENGLDVVWLRVDFKDDCVFSARMVAD